MAGYQPKVYRDNGGDRQVVENGGEIRVNSGGKISNAGTQATKIADLAITYTANDPSITPNNAITVADGSSPSVGELLEFCEELKAKVHAVIDALEGVGITASS